MPTQTLAAAPARESLDGLRAMLEPRSVAVIGATDRAGSVGAAVMTNLLTSGFRGEILPVNPNRTSVAGRQALRRIGDARSPVDLAVVCTPAATIPEVVRQCGEAGVRGLVILSAGFREAGGVGIELEHRTRAELDRFPGLRVIGPNCVGMIAPAIGLNASFARGGVRPGGVALLSQSGALCTALLDWARDKGVGFSHFLSIGNMMDVGFGDLLEYLAEDPRTTSVVLYIEAITDAVRFLAGARRCAAKKPVIAYKAGCHRASARAAASHTGAMAGEDAVYDAAFQETGIIRVRRLDDLLGTTELLARGTWPVGPRLAIVTNAGGPGVIATDALIAGKGDLAYLSEESIAALDSILPPHWSHSNPVDVIGDAPPQRLAAAVEAVLKDPGVDGVVTIVTPQAMIDTTEAARLVAVVASRSRKPVLAVWMGGDMVRGSWNVLQSAGIPTYATPEQAVDAFLHVAAYSKHASRDNSKRTPVPESPEVARTRTDAASFLKNRRGVLGEADSKSLLGLYGLQAIETRAARSGAEAAEIAGQLGYPIALKVMSPHITHKTDVGGVKLNLRNAEEVACAFDDMFRSIAHLAPAAMIEGVTVEPMVDRSQGVELILGAKRDATFGPVVLVGAGGTVAEVLADRAIGLAPTTTGEALRLLRQLRIAPLFGPFRGRAALNLDAAAAAVVGMSRLIAEHPMITEIDANPVLLTPYHAIVLDARIVIGPTPEAAPRVVVEFGRPQA